MTIRIVKDLTKPYNTLEDMEVKWNISEPLPKELDHVGESTLIELSLNLTQLRIIKSLVGDILSPRLKRLADSQESNIYE
jgi:hypothetical protein